MARDIALTINDTKSYIEERHGIFWGRVVRGNSI